MKWANFFHCYQPIDWDPATIRKVTKESYLPFFFWLKAHPQIRVTVNVSATLTEQLSRLGFEDVLATIAMLGKAGQVALTGTAMYHPILPLTNADSARRQIVRNTQRNRALLGSWYDPKGFFFPEMAYSAAVGTLVAALGFRWMVLDEIAYNGTLGAATLDHTYQTAEGVPLIFLRNRVVSDYLFLSAQLDAPEAFWRVVQKDGRSKRVLLTAMDGENLGHHRPGLDRYWQTLVADSSVTTVLYDELLDELPSAVHTLLPCSWASNEDELSRDIPYVLWQNPDNPIHAAQWALTRRVTELVHRPEVSNDALMRFDQALSSDQYWWASAEPWWDSETVVRGANRLAAVTESLRLSKEERAQIAALRATIQTLVTDWQHRGEPQKRQQDYLRRHRTVRRIGGTLLTEQAS